MTSEQRAAAVVRAAADMPPPLRLRVIGGLVVEGIDEHALGSRKARTALRVLALARGAPVSVDRLAEVLWKDDQPSAPAAQLAVIISRLRRVLGPGRITYGDAGYRLHYDWLDLASLDDLASEAERRLAAQSPTGALAAATAARALLPRQVLADDTWPADLRPLMERLEGRVRRLVARTALAAGDLATGIEAAEELLDANPYDEEALRLAMAGLSAVGQSSSALALHERIRAHLADELGVSPSPETDAAHRAVLKGLPIAGVGIAVGIATAGFGDSPSIRTLVGRDDELRALDGLFASVGAGDPIVVMVQGEPGIGKTALATAWVERLGVATQILSTRCEQPGRALPLQAAFQIVRSAVRRAGVDDAARILGRDAPLLAPFLNREAQTPERDADWSLGVVSSPAGIAMLCAALRRVVTRVCVAPSVLLVDDFPRADDLTLGWVADLAATRGLPLLILLTQRSGEAKAIAGARVIDVSPLSMADAVLITGPARAAELHHRSGGNPLFLTLLASENLDELPETVQSAILARCAEAPGAAKTLRSAAVLGTEVNVDLLAEVLRVDPIQLLDDLDEGVRLAILAERGGGYAFRHAVVREAMEAAASSPRRALLHRRAALALTARPGADPMAIAHHARLSGARSLASAALTAASRIAAERFDYATALSLSDEAIAADDVAAARVQRATILLRQARYEDARVDAETAAQGGQDADAWEVAGSIAYYCRDFQGAAAYGEAMLEHARDPRQRLQALVIRGRALHAEGQVSSADRSIEAAMQLSRQHRLRRPTPVYAFLKVHMGQAALALRVLDASRHASTEALSTIYTPVHAEFIRGYALATCGRAGQALGILARAADQADRRGLIRYASLGANMSAWVYRNIGAVARAREGNEAARQGARAAGYRELEVYAALDLCDDAVAEGDVAGVGRQLEQSAQLMREPYAYDWRHRLRVSLVRGRLALLTGDPEAALRQADHVLADAAAYRAPRYAHLAELLRLRSRAVLAAEPPSEAGLRQLSSSLSSVAGLEAWWLLGELAAALDSPLCWTLANEHRSRLSATLEGEDADRFARHSGERLERMRILGRSA